MCILLKKSQPIRYKIDWNTCGRQKSKFTNNIKCLKTRRRELKKKIIKKIVLIQYKKKYFN